MLYVLVKKIVFYIKSGLYYLLNRRIHAYDYAADYNRISQTYNRWTDKMGKHQDKMLSVLTGCKKSVLNILDFCCGTGYITQKILSAYPQQEQWRITAVDISAGMIQKCRDTIRDCRVVFVEDDGSRFLQKTGAAAYDLIFCGWGLVYFKPVKIIREFRRILTAQGCVCVIMNRQGTLDKIEEIFLEIMKEDPLAIRKIMDIRHSLPCGKGRFEKWFTCNGFTVLAAGEGEEFFTYATAGELLTWLEETGAIAGTPGIMAGRDADSRNRLREKIIRKIDKKLKTNGEYRINHKFVYGNFRKRSC